MREVNLAKNTITLKFAFSKLFYICGASHEILLSLSSDLRKDLAFLNPKSAKSPQSNFLRTICFFNIIQNTNNKKRLTSYIM